MRPTEKQIEIAKQILEMLEKEASRIISTVGSERAKRMFGELQKAKKDLATMISDAASPNRRP